MDINKLNPIVAKMVKDLMSVRKGLPLAGALSAVNYKLANIVSQLHISVDTKSGYKPTPLNIYSLTLLKSGAGKNASLGILDRFYFGEAFDLIRSKVFPFYKQKAMTTLEEKGIERDLHTWTQSISNATISGIYAYAETYCLTGFGSLNIEVDEVANAVTSKAELFEQLLTPYDNGDFMPVAKRTDSSSMDITGLPVNLYCFGNKVRLMNGDNVEREFIRLLDEGYGRRFLFIDDDSKPVNRTPQEVLDEMDKAEKLRSERQNERDYIKSLINSNNFKKVLGFSREAMLFYATIKSESDDYLSNNSGLPQAVQADISERHFKTIKLAGIYAFIDGNDEVTFKNMEEAYEVVKSSSEVLYNLRRTRSIQDRLLEALILEPEPITSQRMLEYSFINSTWTKKILEYVDLAKQLASEKGYEWDEFTKGGVTYYRVINETVAKEEIW